MEEGALAIALIKGLHVNSHVGYETDVDMSGKTKEDLKEILSDIFDNLQATEHFNVLLVG